MFYVWLLVDVNILHKQVQQIYKQHISNDIEVCGIIIEPYTSNILAIAGGKDYGLSQYNRHPEGFFTHYEHQVSLEGIFHEKLSVRTI